MSQILKENQIFYFEQFPLKESIFKILYLIKLYCFHLKEIRKRELVNSLIKNQC